MLAAACVRLRVCRSAVAQLRLHAPVQAAVAAQGVPFVAAQLSAVAAPQPEPSQGPLAGAWQPLFGAHPRCVSLEPFTQVDLVNTLVVLGNREAAIYPPRCFPVVYCYIHYSMQIKS